MRLGSLPLLFLTALIFGAVNECIATDNTEVQQITTLEEFYAWLGNVKEIYDGEMRKDDTSFPMNIFVTDATVDAVNGCYTRSTDDMFRSSGVGDFGETLFSPVYGRYTYKNENGYAFKHSFRSFSQDGCGWYWIIARPDGRGHAIQNDGVSEHFPLGEVFKNALGSEQFSQMFPLFYKTMPYIMLGWGDITQLPPTDGWHRGTNTQLPLRVWEGLDPAFIAAAQDAMSSVLDSDDLKTLILQFLGHLKRVPTPKQRKFTPAQHDEGG